MSNLKLAVGVRQTLAFEAAKAAFVVVAEAFTPTAARPAAEAAGEHHEARAGGLPPRKKVTDNR